jgi:hypothetical protein
VHYSSVYNNGNNKHTYILKLVYIHNELHVSVKGLAIFRDVKYKVRYIKVQNKIIKLLEPIPRCNCNYKNQ